jgi:hypothetical protein
MIKEMEPVKTLTVRAYCLCPAGNGTNQCFNEEQAQASIASKDASKRSQPTIMRIGPQTKLKPPPGPATQ